MIFGYVRVSTAEQADSGAGLEAQRRAIAADAARRGWEGVEWVTDAGFSAKSMRRPGLAAILERVAPGDVLMVASMSRLSRSLLDFASIMERARAGNWSLVALDSPADMATPSGEFMASIMAAWGAMERRIISQRTKDALAVKRSQGVRLGRPREVSSDVEAAVCAMKDAGLTFAEIAAALADAGHLPPRSEHWSSASLHRIVKRAAA